MLHFKGCDSKTTREHLRFACYKGKGSGYKQFEPYNGRDYYIIKLVSTCFVAIAITRNGSDEGKLLCLTGAEGELDCVAG